MIIASFLPKFKNRAPVIEVPDLLAPGKAAKDCQMPITKTSLAVISENLRWLGFLSDTKSNRANIKLENATISTCLDRSRRRAYSKDKAINTSGKVAKAKKKTDLLTPFFIKTFFICSFRGFETNKITANRLPICMAMSRLKSFLRPITNLL